MLVSFRAHAKISTISYGVVLVSAACRITHLSLRYNQIGDAGAAQLGRCLGNVTSQNTHLMTLNLAGNRITDVGACCIANVSYTNHFTS